VDSRLRGNDDEAFRQYGVWTALSKKRIFFADYRVIPAQAGIHGRLRLPAGAHVRHSREGGNPWPVLGNPQKMTPAIVSEGGRLAVIA